MDTTVEDRVRSALTAGIDRIEAACGPPVADVADLARRRVRHHRRQQAGRGIAAVVVLVTAVAGGWAVGRDDPGEGVVAADPTTTADPSTTAAAPTTSGPPTTVAETDPHEGETLLVTRFPSTLMSDRGDMGVPTAPLFSRTLADGTVVDVRGGAFADATDGVPPFWAPPAWCLPSGLVVLDARLPGGTASAGSSRYDATPPGELLVGTTVVGADQDEPRWLALVQPPEGTALVEATFAGGTTDEVAPQQGLAVLGAPLTGAVPDPWQVLEPGAPEITVVARAADGSALARYEGPWTGVGKATSMDDADLRPVEGCAVPTALPAPGAEQPDDPAAAEAAVRATWDGAFGQPGAVTDEAQRAAVDDPRGLAEAQAGVRRTRSPEELDQISTTVDGVVFADATTAYLEYTVHAGPLGTYDDRFAEAVLVEGRWKVSRESACRLAGFAGGICPPL